MATAPQNTPSFSPMRKWRIGLNVGLVLLAALSVVLMLNYLSQEHHRQFNWSIRTQTSLSPVTMKLLRSLTNEVKVTLYYDKHDSLYPTVSALLKQYSQINPRISFQPVDYLRDVAAAQQIKEKYKLSAATDKNLVIFDCAGKLQSVPGDTLAKYVIEQIPDEKERLFRRKPALFEGEKAFTAALLAVTNPKPLTAYILQDHGEHVFDSDDENYGYAKFTAMMNLSYIKVLPLSLLGNKDVPADCHLLILAGPRTAIPEPELDKIDHYLEQGGRLLVLLNPASPTQGTGLGRLLSKWGIQVGTAIVKDPDQTVFGMDVMVRDFNRQHPIMNPISSELYLIRPRSVGKLNLRVQTADAPSVEEIAFSGKNAFASDDPGHPQRFPLMVAVEKGAIKGAVTERGSTRIVVVGDSIFLANTPIESADNRSFAWLAVNWLTARTQLLEGVGPKSVTEYRLVISKLQLQSLEWILLGGMPGGILVLAGLVWLRRRG